MEKLKKILAKFWYIIAAVGGGVVAVLFLGRRGKKDNNYETVGAVEIIEQEKERLVSEVEALDKEHEKIKEEMDDLIAEAKEDIESTLKEEKSDEAVLSDFNDSW